MGDDANPDLRSFGDNFRVKAAYDPTDEKLRRVEVADLLGELVDRINWAVDAHNDLLEAVAVEFWAEMYLSMEDGEPSIAVIGPGEFGGVSGHLPISKLRYPYDEPDNWPGGEPSDEYAALGAASRAKLAAALRMLADQVEGGPPEPNAPEGV